MRFNDICTHAVQFYDDDKELIDSLLSSMEPVLRAGQGSLVIATSDHLLAFEKGLLKLGFETEKLKSDGQLVQLDAVDTLKRIMIDGLPDANKFRELVIPLLEKMTNDHSKVNAYGEMVGILWARGNSQGTVLLEQLWNDLAKTVEFNLYCGYGSYLFNDTKDLAVFDQICNEHNDFLPAQSHTIAKLRQRERVLLNEIEQRIRAESELNDFFENAAIGLHVVDAEGNILKANRYELNLLGYTEEEYVGHNIAEFHEDLGVIKNLLERLANNEILKEAPARLKCKDGTIKSVLITSNVSWRDGKFINTRCFTRDVTEQNRLVDQMFSQAHSFMTILSVPEFRYLRSNAQHLKLIRKTNIIGKTLLEVEPELKDQGIIELLNQVVESGESYIGTEIPIHYDPVNGEPAKTCYLDFVYQPLKNPEGKVYAISAQGYEVTDKVLDRQRLEKAEKKAKKDANELAAERKKLEAIFYQSDFPLVLFRGPQLVYEMVNDKYLELISFRDVIGKPLLEALPEIAESEFPRKIKEVHDTGKPIRFLEGHTPIYNPAKGLLEDRYFDTTFARVFDEVSGEFLVIGNAMDVTERFQSRAAVMESKKTIENERENFRNLFEQSPELICILSGAEHRFEFVNDSHVQLLGFNATGKTVREAQPESVEVHGILDKVYATGHTAKLHEISVTLGDRTRFFNLTYAARKDSLGQINGIMILGVEVTEQIEARRALKASKEEAERANELKSSFLANMSHEIRTPLGAILGFTDLLRDPGLTPEEHSNYIDIVTRNGEQLAAIINDILDLSKVEAGHLTLDYAAMNPEDAITDVISLLRVKANEKNLALEFQKDPSTPNSLVTDDLRLRQILLNIVGNAIKFTQAGSVHVRSFGKIDSSGQNHLCFEVTDTGIGIPRPEHEKIFNAFVQADSTLSRKFGGTGLGLALSRKLARSLGGDVSIVQSVENKGTAILISLIDQPKLKNSESNIHIENSKEREFAANALENVRVLVVDDSPDNRHLIWLFLSKYGATIDFAENGLLGYRKALNEKFDLVLMDIQMPVMDGYTATQKLRDAGYRKPVIALSAHAMSEVRKKSLNVGCNDHISKPIKARQLIEIVAKYTENTLH